PAMARPLVDAHRPDTAPLAADAEVQAGGVATATRLPRRPGLGHDDHPPLGVGRQGRGRTAALTTRRGPPPCGAGIEVGDCLLDRGGVLVGVPTAGDEERKVESVPGSYGIG